MKERVTQILDKERCIKEQIYLELLYVAFRSPVKCFSGVKFRAKFEVVPQKQFLSVTANHSKSDLSFVNWVAHSEEIRYVFSTEILSNIVTIREVNSTEIYCWNFCLKLYRERHTEVRAITTLSYKQPTNSHNFKKLNWIYLRWLSLALKLNRDKLTLINCLWKCKKGERLTITATSLTKVDRRDGFGHCGGPPEKIPSASEITGFDEFRPLTSWKKDKRSYGLGTLLS